MLIKPSPLLRKIKAALPELLMQIEATRRGLPCLLPQVEKLRQQQALLSAQIEMVARGESPRLH